MVRQALMVALGVLLLATAASHRETVIVAVIPWLVLIVPAMWLLARLWRKLRRKRSVPPPTSAVAP